MNPLSCLDGKKNIGVSECKKFPQLIKGMITTPTNFSLSPSDAIDPTKWQDAILANKSSRIYLWPLAVNVEVASEDAVYEETPLTTMAVRDGRYRFRMMFSENLEIHKNIFSHRGFNGRAFLIDNENKIIGTELPNGNFAGFDLDLLNPEKIMFNDGSVRSKTPIYLSLADNLELDDKGAMIDGTFIRSLIGLTTAKLTIVGASASEITVDVKSAIDNEPVIGLVVGDFVKLTSAGASETIDTSVESATIEGRYVLSPDSTFSNGTLNLVAASALSVVGFEGQSVEVTV